MALSLPEQITAAIIRSRHLLIAIPRHYSVDAVASATAIALLLRQAGKVLDVVADGFPLARPFPFLPQLDIHPELPAVQQLLVAVKLGGTELEQFSYDVRGDLLTIYLTPKSGTLLPDAVSVKPGAARYDLILTVNAADVESLGNIYARQRELFETTPIINIDCQASNEHYGQINAVELTAAATAEIVYDLTPALRSAGTLSGEPFSPDIATSLLAGLIDATGSFRTARATAKTLRIASTLVEAGGNRDGIVKALYQSHSITALNLWGRTLTRLKSDLNGKLVWATVPEADFLDAGATFNDLPGVTDALLRYLPTAEIVVLLAQVGPEVMVRLNSLRNIPASAVTQPYPADGDRHLATWHIKGQTLPEAERAVVASVRDNLQKLTQ